MNKGRILAMNRKNTRSEPLVLRAFDAAGTPLIWMAAIALGVTTIAQISIYAARVIQGAHVG
jgi:hypothetical protein